MNKTVFTIWKWRLNISNLNHKKNRIHQICKELQVDTHTFTLGVLGSVFPSGSNDPLGNTPPRTATVKALVYPPVKPCIFVVYSPSSYIPIKYTYHYPSLGILYPHIWPANPIYLPSFQCVSSIHTSQTTPLFHPPNLPTIIPMCVSSLHLGPGHPDEYIVVAHVIYTYPGVLVIWNWSMGHRNS